MHLIYEILKIATCLICVTAVYIPPSVRYKCPEKAEVIYPCKCLKGSDEGLYVRCENSNLASLSLSFNNLATFKQPIEELIIYKCNIARFYGSLFFKSKVRILRIEETPVKIIDEHTFYGINHTLQELHIIKSNLIEFPKKAFKVLSNLTILNIDHHEITTLATDIFADSLALGSLEKLRLTNGKLTDLPVESFQSLRKLKTLDLHGNTLTVLKRNQFKNLRDVEVLDISHNNITKLDSSHISDLTKLGFCNVSHNALTELTRGAFARNSVLRVLNMAHNQIKRLDANSFRGMRFLRRLYLSDNMITEVGRGTFGSITRIGTIDLARNGIKKIDYQMFAQLNYVEILDMAENNITEIQKQSFKDLYLTTINISHNAISKIEPNSFENCVNITILDLSYNNIKEIPRNAFDSTTYANEFQLSFNQLTNMSQVPLQNMTGLRILNVSHNHITTIPKNTFPKLYELHTIDASHNEISEIFNAVFQSLFSLRSLNLSHNSLEVLKPPTFGSMTTLLELDLSNNQLNDIAKGGLAKLSSCRVLTLENNMLDKIFQIPISLNYLNLKNNSIKEVPERTWPVMNALLSLDLADNYLSNNLHSGSFSGLLTLQSLYLNNNGISKVPWESLAGLTTLQYLHLENNNITELAKGAFGKLPVVFELNLHNNQIFIISKRAFDGLLQLLTLNLSSNAIRTIPNDAFIGLVSLRHLDLSHNLLEKLDNKTNGVLDDCLSLETINLQNNRISFVTRKTFPSNPYIPYRLREINLSYNTMPVLTYDITFGTKKVKYLNVSHNSLSDIRKGILGNLTGLEVLDMSYNGLTDLTAEENIFNLPENITKLYLQNNKLVNIPVDKIVNATNLKELDLRNNMLSDIDVKLVDSIKNGLDVFFEGNPLKCDCTLRPLKHYLYTFTDPPQSYSKTYCDSPQYVAGQSLVTVGDDQLNCVKNINVSSSKLSGEDYDIQPDLRFRKIAYSKGRLFLQWFIPAQRDIADFYVNIRDSKNSILFERHLSYDSRTVEIDGTEIHDTNRGGKPLQVCVLSKTSEGIIGGWYESQCENLPMDLERVKNKYTTNYNSAFTILSTDKRTKVSESLTKSSGIVNKLNNILTFSCFAKLIIYYYIIM